jgi:hypothetical protein
MRQIALATLVAFTLAFVGGPLVQPVEAQGQGNGNGNGNGNRAASAASIAIPVTGTAPGSLFAGTFNLQRFAVVDGVLTAVGTLVGSLTTPLGSTSIVRTLAIPVNPVTTQAVCEILHLELGPLDLNLLGLVVHLDRIVLDIDAVPGAGNLLGNLLCAVAGLLDGGSLGNVADLLNRILSILG